MIAMELAHQKIAQVLAASASPAVLCSFGKDSVLLLDLVREVQPNTPVLWFRTGLDQSYARQMIRAWDLTVFGWPPADRYLLEGDGLTLVCEYGINGAVLPMLVDAVDGGECGTNVYTPNVTVPFDTLLVGWKDTDTHWVKGKAMLAEDGYTLGHTQLVAPLRHMTDQAVLAAIQERRIPFTPTLDELPICRHCISTKPVEEFRSRFNLKEAFDGPDIR